MRVVQSYVNGPCRPWFQWLVYYTLSVFIEYAKIILNSLSAMAICAIDR